MSETCTLIFSSHVSMTVLLLIRLHKMRTRFYNFLGISMIQLETLTLFGCANIWRKDAKI